MSKLHLYLLPGPFDPVCHTHPHANTHHLPLPQLQMSPLVRVQCTLCCRPIMAAEISIMIITVPSAAISTDGRSLFRNELSTHQRAHCRLCYLARCARNSVSVCVITCVQPHVPSLYRVWWTLKGKLVIKIALYSHKWWSDIHILQLSLFGALLQWMDAINLHCQLCFTFSCFIWF